jgi:hypothetical protein
VHAPCGERRWRMVLRQAGETREVAGGRVGEVECGASMLPRAEQIQQNIRKRVPWRGFLERFPACVDDSTMRRVK